MSTAGQEQSGVSLCDPNFGKIEEDTNNMKWNGRQTLRLQKLFLMMQRWYKLNVLLLLRRQEPFAGWLELESVCFDLKGKLNEDCSRNKTKKRTSMKEDAEGRWKKDEEKISRRSHSLSSSFQVDFFRSSLC